MAKKANAHDDEDDEETHPHPHPHDKAAHPPVKEAQHPHDKAHPPGVEVGPAKAEPPHEPTEQEVYVEALKRCPGMAEQKLAADLSAPGGIHWSQIGPRILSLHLGCLLEKYPPTQANSQGDLTPLKPSPLS